MTETDAAQWVSWVGRTTDADDTVTPRLVESYRSTLEPYLASVEVTFAPLGLHWCLAPPRVATSELAPDGHPGKGVFLPPAPLPRRMWAGGKLEILAPLEIGAFVRRHSRIGRIDVKPGRSGPLYLIEVQHEYSIAHRIVLRERQDIIYREAATGSAKSRAEAIGQRQRPTLAWGIEASPVLLFRYSALTFNSHRIHYDQPYATTVEGYAGVVVQGPLQASLLLNLAAVLLGRSPLRFSYRSTAPLIACQTFEVGGAREQAGVVRCWVRDAAGLTTCEASAA